MPNMSYCRFENTLGDLQDCYDAISEGENDKLSFDERLARWRLIRLCVQFAADYGHIADEPKPKREAA